MKAIWRAVPVALTLFTAGCLLLTAVMVGARAAYYGIASPPEWLQRECSRLMLETVRHAGVLLSSLPWQAATVAALAVGMWISRRPFFETATDGRLRLRLWVLAVIAVLLMRAHPALDADPFMTALWVPTLFLYAAATLSVRGAAPSMWRKRPLLGVVLIALLAAALLAPSVSVRVAVATWGATLLGVHRLTRRLHARDACWVALCAAPLSAFIVPASLPLIAPALREGRPVVIDDHGYAYGYCEVPGTHRLFMTVPVGQTDSLEALRAGYVAELDLRTGERKEHRLFSDDFYGGLRMILCLRDGSVQVTMKQVMIGSAISESNVLEFHADEPERVKRSVFAGKHRRARGADVLGHAAAYDAERDAVFYVSEWTNSLFRLDRASKTLDTSLSALLPAQADTHGEIGPQTGQYGPQTGPAAVHARRRTLYLAEWADASTIYELDLDALVIRRRFDTRDSGSFGLAVDEERDRLYASGLWGVNVIDLGSGEIVARMRTGLGARAAVIDARRDLVYVPTTLGGHMWVYDRDDHRPLGRVTTGLGGRPAYLTQDGRFLFASDQARVLRWDAEKLARRLRGSS